MPRRTAAVAAAIATLALLSTLPRPAPASSGSDAPTLDTPTLDIPTQRAHTRRAHTRHTHAERPSLFGRVLDPAGSERATALVLAVDTHNLLRRPPAAVTDKRGRFQFSELPPGRYVLIAIHGHHSPGRSDPVVVGDLPIPFPLKLTLGEAAPVL